jgi:hypothetical protein
MIIINVIVIKTIIIRQQSSSSSSTTTTFIIIILIIIIIIPTITITITITIIIISISIIIIIATIATVHLQMRRAPHQAPCNARLRLSSESWLAKLECAKHEGNCVASVQVPGPDRSRTAELHRTRPQNQPVAPQAPNTP